MSWIRMFCNSCQGMANLVEVMKYFSSTSSMSVWSKKGNIVGAFHSFRITIFSFFFYKNSVFQARAGYSHLLVDFRLEIFLSIILKL